MIHSQIKAKHKTFSTQRKKKKQGWGGGINYQPEENYGDNIWWYAGVKTIGEIFENM